MCCGESKWDKESWEISGCCVLMDGEVFLFSCFLLQACVKLRQSPDPSLWIPGWNLDVSTASHQFTLTLADLKRHRLDWIRLGFDKIKSQTSAELPAPAALWHSTRSESRLLNPGKLLAGAPGRARSRPGGLQCTSRGQRSSLPKHLNETKTWLDVSPSRPCFFVRFLLISESRLLI